MKSKIIILAAVIIVFASFSFVSSRNEKSQASASTSAHDKNMVDKGQFD